MLPVVAIVGQANVGKSTLFNRLTHSRNAIIADEPGTTRDRQFGIAQTHPRFIVIDTGGLHDDKDEMNQLITQQTQQAIQEADRLLFVIDGQTGPMLEDKKIARALRKTGKPIILAVNKAENGDPDTLVDAYDLGFEQVHPISALHNRGITELIAALFPNKTAETATDDDVSEQGVRLALVGRPNAGKSTLANRLLGEERVIVSDKPGTTRDSIFIPLKHLDKQYTLIDTAGIRKRSKVTHSQEKFSVVKTLQSIESAQVVLYVIDAKEGIADQDLKLLGFVVACGKALVIAVNKWDGLSAAARKQMKDALESALHFLPFVRVQMISALHGTGVGHLLGFVDEAYTSATTSLSTPRLSRLLKEALVSHSPPLKSKRRAKLRYAHMGGKNPPVIVIHGNQLDSLPESYRRFLAHFFQKKLKLYGTPIQIRFKTSQNPFANKR